MFEIGRSSFNASSGVDFGFDESDVNKRFVGNNGMSYAEGA
jgi:hypothetical protein